jgi:nitroreductase
METLEAIRTRRSVRKFLDKKIDVDILKRILGAGIRAPSGCNSQPWRFIVTTDKKKMKHFDPIRHQPWVESSPAMIVACVDPHDTFEKQDEEATDHFFDVGAAIQNILLAIHDLGLGAVWVTGFSRMAVRHKLNIPKHWLIVALIPFGYYRKNSSTKYRGETIPNDWDRGRKPLSKVAFLEDLQCPFK